MTSSSTKSRLAFAAFATWLFVSPAAFAQQAGASERADKLFAEANTLAEAGNFAAACPKFEESQRLEPALGTQFNLALCYEKVGRFGSAYRNLLAVERLAHTSGKRSREEAAKKKREEVAPHIAGYLVFHAADEDATLTVDGEVVDRADRSFFAVDAGQHAVEATAPSKKPWRSTVTMPAGSRTAIKVDVPKLAVEKEIVTKVTTSPRRTAAYVAGGVGLAGLVASAVTGILILDAKSTADELCPVPAGGGKRVCAGEDDTGRNAVSRGKSLLPINAVATAVGIVGVGVGSFLFFTSKSGGSSTGGVEVRPYAGAGGAGILGRF